MEKDLIGGKLGEVGKYDLAFKEGKLVAELDASVSFGEAGLVVKLDAGKVIDALAAAIPGKLDDAIFGVIKGALLGQ